MAYSRKELAKEVTQKIDDKREEGKAIIVGWLVHEVLLDHPEENDLSEFSKCARLEFVTDEVGRCVRRFKEPLPEESTKAGMAPCAMASHSA
jgi:hypothetical protein